MKFKQIHSLFVFSFIVILFFMNNPLYAQSVPWCGSKLGPEELRTEKSFQRYMRSYRPKNQYNRNSVGGIKYYLPALIHFVANDDSSNRQDPDNMLDLLSEVNHSYIKFFNMKYYLVKDNNTGKVYLDNSINNTLANTGSLSPANASDSYMLNVFNLYLVKSLNGIEGYASYPTCGVYQGVAVMSGQNIETWAHEFGHFFNLRHPFDMAAGREYVYRCKRDSIITYNDTIKSNNDTITVYYPCDTILKHPITHLINYPITGINEKVFPVIAVSPNSGYFVVNANLTNMIRKGSIISVYDSTNQKPYSFTVNTNPVTGCRSNSGSAKINVSGGNPPYTYTWNTSPAQSGSIATGLSAGNYVVTVTDQSNCSSSTNISISDAGSLGLTFNKTDVKCKGQLNGKIFVVVTGGKAPYSYKWSPNILNTTDSAIGLPAGTYYVTVTSADTCKVVGSVSVNQPGAIILNMSKKDACTKSNGSASVSVTGGTFPIYTYSWNTIPVQTKSNAVGLPSGNVTVIVTDTNGCTANNTIRINEITAPTLITNKSDAKCKGDLNGSATADLSGGILPFTYSWGTNPSQSRSLATGLKAGTYKVTVTDANSCEVTASSIISEPTSIVLKKDSINATCFGLKNGSVSVIPTGGTSPYSYQWNTIPTQTTSIVNGLGAGTYNVTVSDNNGCTATASTTVNPPTEILLSTSKTNANCKDSSGSVTVTVTGNNSPFTYIWSTNPVQTSSIATQLKTGNYEVTVTDAKGCSASKSESVVDTGNLKITINTIAVKCSGNNNGKAIATVTGGKPPYTYSWNTIPFQDSSVAIGLIAGKYFITVTDTLGCKSATSAMVSEPNNLLLNISKINYACDLVKGNATVTVSGGTSPYTYKWSTSPIQTTSKATGLVKGIYSLTVTDKDSCTVSENIVIDSIPAMVLTPTLIHNFCKGSKTGVASITVSGGTPGYTFSWNITPSQSFPIATGLKAGSYTTTVTDKNGCKMNTSVIINEPSAISMIKNITNPVCYTDKNGSSTPLISGGNPPYSYTWNTSPVQNTSSISGLGVGTYKLTVNDSYGCVFMDSIVILSDPKFVIKSTKTDASYTLINVVETIPVMDSTKGKVTLSKRSFNVNSNRTAYLTAGSQFNVTGSTNGTNDRRYTISFAPRYDSISDETTIWADEWVIDKTPSGRIIGKSIIVQGNLATFFDGSFFLTDSSLIMIEDSTDNFIKMDNDITKIRYFTVNGTPLYNKTTNRSELKLYEDIELSRLVKAKIAYKIRSNCDSTGDLLCGTPASPQFFMGYSGDCIYNNTTSATLEEQPRDSNNFAIDPLGDFYKPDMHNVMDYLYKDCVSEKGTFTLDQVARTQASLDASPGECFSRQYLWYNKPIPKLLDSLGYVKFDAKVDSISTDDSIIIKLDTLRLAIHTSNNNRLDTIIGSKFNKYYQLPYKILRLNIPKLIYPMDKDTFEANYIVDTINSGGVTYIYLRWDEVPNAEGYVVKFFRNRVTTGGKLKKYYTPNNYLKIKIDMNDLNPGKSVIEYRWNVRAISSNHFAFGESVYRPKDFTFVAKPVTRRISSLDEPINKDISMKVYPNPTENGQFLDIFVYTVQPQQSELILSDISGRAIKTQNDKFEKGYTHINMSTADLKPGVYFVQFKSGKQNTTQRVVVF